MTEGGFGEKSPQLDITSPSSFDRALFSFTRRFLVYVVGIVVVLVVGVAAALFLVEVDVGFEGDGEIRPVEMFPVRVHESGIVESIWVHDLQAVAAGDTLLVLDTEDSRSSLIRLETTLVDIDLQIEIRRHDLLSTATRVQREIEVKKVEIERLRIDSEHEHSLWEIDNLGLVDTKRADPYAWKMAETRLAGAQTELRRAEAETLGLRSIQLDVQKLQAERDKVLESCRLERDRIAHATVLAPTAGVVFAHELRLRTGEFVDAGTRLFDVGNPTRWMVRCTVPDRVVPFIRSGQVVHVYIDALPYMVHGIVRGHVSEISAIPSHTSAGNEFLVDSVIVDERFQEYLTGGYNLNGLRVTTKYLVERRSIARNLWQTIRERGSRFEMARRI